MSQIILASNSPRRKQLLTEAGFEFEIIVANTNESYPTHLQAHEIANHIAKQKALAVKEMKKNSATIIAADTIVVIDEEILGKPKDKSDAINMLQKLSGKKHVVITGVCILKDNELIEFFEKTNVYFKQLDLQQIEYYVERHKPFDKAGAYAIQEWIGLVGIEKIEGCYYNVVGLPVAKLISFL
jgi:septum formation protein